MSFGVDVGQDGRWSVVAISGEVDLATAPRVRDEITTLLAKGMTDVVVDMRGVGFIDSSGLGVLIGALKRIRSHDGEMRLVCDSPTILRVLAITGLDQIFTVHRSIADLDPQ